MNEIIQQIRLNINPKEMLVPRNLNKIQVIDIIIECGKNCQQDYSEFIEGLLFWNIKGMKGFKDKFYMKPSKGFLFQENVN